jgi:hypothetical protein
VRQGGFPIRGLFAVATAVAALCLPASAAADPPVLASVGQQNRHPTATFSAPGADFATIYVARKPDRASDGSFLSENVETLDPLTSEEVERGVWVGAGQIDPGTYYVMLRAHDYDCFRTPACTEGFSNVKTLRVPTPRPAYRTKVVGVLRSSGVLYLRLTVTPLGERLPYRVCWRLKSKKRRCASGTVDGYSWRSSASDTLTVRMRGMGNRTTFTWYVRGRAVSAKTAITRR